MNINKNKLPLLASSLIVAASVATPALAQDGSSLTTVFANIATAIGVGGVAYLAAKGAFVVFPWLGRLLSAK